MSSPGKALKANRRYCSPANRAGRGARGPLSAFTDLYASSVDKGGNRIGR